MTTQREKKLGNQIRATRLRKNMTQEEVAERIGVSLPTISRLESGRGSSMDTFIKVVEVLGEGKWLDSFAPAVSISPIAMRHTGRTRERASGKKIGKKSLKKKD